MNPTHKQSTATAIRGPRAMAVPKIATGNTITSRMAYSIGEAAQIAGVGRSLLYTEIKAGRLPVKKAGRRSLVCDADLKAWLASLPGKIA